MKHFGRVRRLEKHHRLDRSGCPGCRERRGLGVLVIVTRQPDGTILRSPEAPPPCDRCGTVPEEILEVIQTVVEKGGEDGGPLLEGRR
jgi:hypothetical protein